MLKLLNKTIKNVNNQHIKKDLVTIKYLQKIKTNMYINQLKKRKGINITCIM